MLLTTHGCLDAPADSSKDRKYTYTYDKLESAWKEKDEGYMRFAIEALKDTTFSDCQYAFRAEELQNVTGFSFCWIDCGDESWINVPIPDKKIYREIIGMAFMEYSNSCMFLKDVDWILCSDVDLYEYCNPDLFRKNKDDWTHSIRTMIKKICRDCR